jgi:hypothetical protein
VVDDDDDLIKPPPAPPPAPAPPPLRRLLVPDALDTLSVREKGTLLLLVSLTASCGSDENMAAWLGGEADEGGKEGDDGGEKVEAWWKSGAAAAASLLPCSRKDGACLRPVVVDVAVPTTSPAVENDASERGEVGCDVHGDEGDESRLFCSFLGPAGL